MLAGCAWTQIGGLSTTADGQGVYFSNTDGSLRKRGSDESFLTKVYLLRDGQVTLLEDSYDLHTPQTPSSYLRPAVSADGRVVAINRELQCLVPGICIGIETTTTTIKTPDRTFMFPANAHVTANGRFAAIHTWNSVQLLDLSTGQLTYAGVRAGRGGQLVAEDGTVFASTAQGYQLVGPSMSAPFALVGLPFTTNLAGDASRIVYDTLSGSSGDRFEIHVYDVKSGTDWSPGPGMDPRLARDGRRYSYLRADDGSTPSGVTSTAQVWVGDAIAGTVRRLSNETDSIIDQTITGDGVAVIATTGTGRLLSIDTTSGAITQLLGSPGPPNLFVASVPGSYNEVVGPFPGGAPEVLIGIARARAVVLGRSPRGFAIQVPWEATGPMVLIRGNELAWERRPNSASVYFALEFLPAGPLEVNPRYGTKASSGTVTSYALHEDWSGPVNHENPARPGEIVHFYASGFGPVDGSVATGQPTPTDRLYSIRADTCKWSAAGDREKRPFDVLFAGLAPALVGVYQLDVRIPRDWKEPVFRAGCDTLEGPAATPTIEVQLP